MLTLPNLPDAIARETHAALCDLLPPPLDGNQEALAARLEAGMEAVATPSRSCSPPRSSVPRAMCGNACARRRTTATT
jgi:hypothetical protein